jgi:K+-sensing histidine kinase KdpD
LSHQAWTEMLHTRSNLGFLKSEHGVFPAGEVWQPEMEKAFRTGKAVSGPDDAMSLAAPVKVRDQVIGVIDAHKTQGEWTPAEIALVESLTEQIGVALESARLFQDSQHRAARERLLREVTARVRSSADPETVLKSLLREVGTVLGRSTFVRLGSAEQLAHSPQAASGNSRDTLSQEGN